MLEFASLSSHEVPTERSEGETRSPTDASLLAIINLLFNEVCKSEAKTNSNIEIEIFGVEDTM